VLQHRPALLVWRAGRPPRVAHDAHNTPQQKKKKKKTDPLIQSQVSVALIIFFNYYYTFLQLEPADLAEQLKRQGASIPAVRPGRATADYVTRTLTRMSVLGSAFLGALAAAPPATEALTGLTAFRGFAGTSLLILVGVATDTARKIKAEQVREREGKMGAAGGERCGLNGMGKLWARRALTRTLSLPPFLGHGQVPGHRQAVRRLGQMMERSEEG